MNCNTTHYRANSSSVPGDPTVGGEYRSPLQGETVDVWLPLALDIPDRAQRSWHYCNAIARARAGVDPRQLSEEVALRAAAWARENPGGMAWSMRVEPLLSEVTGRSRQIVWLLVAAGGLVLLLACANIAGLSVARAVARRGELALRHALGANRWQLVRVGLAENLVIGLGGAALGVALAAAGLPLLRKLLPADFPRAHEVALTASSAAFAAAIAIATALLAGLVPTRRVAAATARVTAGRDARRLRSWLVGGEVALAGLLCAGSLFLLRSDQQLGARDHGFRPEGVLTFQLTVPTTDRELRARTLESIRVAIAALPGVAAVGATTNLPWSGYDENTGFVLPGLTVDSDDGPSARFQGATPGYFEATGMRLVEGRFFDPVRESSTARKAAIVNDALARRYVPAGRPVIGATIDVFEQEREIVGVVGGITDHPADADVKPAFWLPVAQSAFPTVTFAVRAAKGDPAALTSAVTAAVRGVDSELAVADVRTLERRVAGALASRRFALSLFQAFAGLALVLASAGIYGLLAYLVQQRRKELGIRAALGASRGSLGSMILLQGLKMAGAGALCCVLLIPVGGSLLQAFLYQVRPLDAATLLLAPTALLLAAGLASVGPARSATRSDPATVLRED